jgi:hypothetical protein
MRVSKVLPISTKSNKPVRVSVWLRETEKKAKTDKKEKKARGAK